MRGVFPGRTVWYTCSRTGERREWTCSAEICSRVSGLVRYRRDKSIFVAGGLGAYPLSLGCVAVGFHWCGGSWDPTDFWDQRIFVCLWRVLFLPSVWLGRVGAGGCVVWIACAAVGACPFHPWDVGDAGRFCCESSGAVPFSVAVLGIVCCDTLGMRAPGVSGGLTPGGCGGADRVVEESELRGVCACRIS